MIGGGILTPGLNSKQRIFELGRWYTGYIILILYFTDDIIIM